LTVGFFLVSDWARQKEAAALTLAAVSGVALIAIGIWLDSRPVQLYSVYDFWHTSPNFFLVRTGILLMILLTSYTWCRWGVGKWSFSPLIELGKSSLLVYWVHIEFVYGGLSILPKHGVGIATATLGLLTIFTAMTLLAVIRTRFQGRGGEMWAMFRRTERTY
jgi:fucose 4-O-acetylase-like acetyltransferase